MADLPNPDDFSFVDSPNEFRVTFEVKGEVNMTIYAENIEDARAKAREQVEEIVSESGTCELDAVDDVEVGRIYQKPRMYFVTDEDGRKMRVSRLEAGMVPREPDEHGF
ncbi:MAG: hypothetical protein EP336_09625 [Rhodobacteraceae bacterium]|nr:MAG: hypothetical protein EP336_09625 [Paracoccaceae bacterium]